MRHLRQLPAEPKLLKADLHDAWLPASPCGSPTKRPAVLIISPAVCNNVNEKRAAGALAKAEVLVGE